MERIKQSGTRIYPCVNLMRKGNGQWRVFWSNEPNDFDDYATNSEAENAIIARKVSSNRISIKSLT